MILKKIIVILSVLLFSSLLLTALPSSVSACSCAVVSEPQTSYNHAEAVFSGKVIDIRRNNRSGYSPLKVYFEVKETWKGINETQVIINTGLGGGDCGVAFEVGKEYMVYASKSSIYDTSGLSTTICTNTGLLSNAQADLDFLGEGEAPTEEVNIMEEEKRKSWFMWGGIIVMLVSISIVGIILYRKKR